MKHEWADFDCDWYNYYTWRSRHVATYEQMKCEGTEPTAVQVKAYFRPLVSAVAYSGVHVCMRLETRSTIRSFTVLTQHSKMMPHYRHPCFKS